MSMRWDFVYAMSFLGGMAAIGFGDEVVFVDGVEF